MHANAVSKLAHSNTFRGCVYSIHKSTIEELDAGQPPGTPITFAKVGDKVSINAR